MALADKLDTEQAQPKKRVAEQFEHAPEECERPRPQARNKNVHHQSPEQPRAEETGADVEGTEDAGETVGAGEGSSPATPEPEFHISGVQYVPQPHGGKLLAGGVPGHDGSNAGRPKGISRDSLLDAAGTASERYLKQRDGWLDRAIKHLEEGEDAKAERCQKQANAIQEAYYKYSIGTRNTVSLDNDAFLMRTEMVLNRTLTPELLTEGPAAVKLALARALRDALSE